jgi:predicted nucleotide-binding protein
MSRRKQAQNDPKGPTMTPDVAIKFLSQQLEQGRALFSKPPVEENSYDVWVHTTSELLAKAFGDGSNNISRFRDVGYLGFYTDSMDETFFRNQRLESLKTQLAYLEGMIDLLRKDVELRGLPVPEVAREPEPMSDTVFVVHGRDNGTKETVARFVEKLGLTAVVLHEQPNKGRTIIEKFTDHAEGVGYAIVLMTPDDRGGLVTDAPDRYAFRARQNVVLELGFFLALLGRGRVCALYSPGVEIPSDYKGVGYVELDPNGAWRAALAKEIAAVGIKIKLKALT